MILRHAPRQSSSPSRWKMRAAAFLRAAVTCSPVRGTPRQESLGTRPGVVDRAKGRQGAGRRHHLSEPAGHGLHVRHRGASGGRRGAAAGQRRCALDRVSISVAQPSVMFRLRRPRKAITGRRSRRWAAAVASPHRCPPSSLVFFFETRGKRWPRQNESCTSPDDARPPPRKRSRTVKRPPAHGPALPRMPLSELPALKALMARPSSPGPAAVTPRVPGRNAPS